MLVDDAMLTGEDATLAESLLLRRVRLAHQKDIVRTSPTTPLICVYLVARVVWRGRCGGESDVVATWS